ncbi:MAG: hypothetical protein B7Z73_19870, partial [Planctomycetia bacterium 21-64-5]
LAKPIGEPDQPVALGPASDEAAAAEDAPGDEPQRRPAWTSPTAPTQMGSAIGTPAYMSPEQAAGELDRIGVASDVYSLGATLYCLLAGRAPFDDESPARLLERVRRGDLTPPRAVRADVPAALESICLKAMAFDPANRYSSPAALADELERWLADEPVSAHRAEWHERLARWARRHRRGVEAAAAALVVVAVVASAAAVIVHSAKQQAEHERDATRIALEAEKEAKRQAHAALAAEREARLRVGRIHHATGSHQQAMDAFRQALAAFEKLAAKHPEQSQYQRDLALCYRSLAELKVRAGQLQAAVGDFRQSAGIVEKLVLGHSQDGDRRELADTNADLGDALAGLEQWEAATEAYRRSMAIFEPLLAASPDDAELQSAMGRSLGGAASALQELGRNDESRAAYRQAVDHVRSAVRLAPKNGRYPEQLEQYLQE